MSRLLKVNARRRALRAKRATLHRAVDEVVATRRKKTRATA